MNQVVSFTPTEQIPREVLEALEEEMKQHPPERGTLRHHFSGGIYARELTLPAGTLVTSKIHKYDGMLILAQGETSISTQDGIIRVKAPYTFITSAGMKRILYTHNECVFIALHATELTDVAQIEAHFIAQSNDEYLEFARLQLEAQQEEQKCLGSESVQQQ